MAQRVNVTLEDDLDGGKADETIQFGIDGISYEIDLSRKNAKALRDAVAEYVGAGRKVSARRSGRGRPERSSDSAVIREWAAAAGYELSTRGRIPAKVRQAYHDSL